MSILLLNEGLIFLETKGCIGGEVNAKVCCDKSNYHGTTN